ncbi:MAG: hypothetical protein HQK79_03280 [Desulfobacterales bacterium]|nr:hypothetical protein [Desulfobacterales bacterium]MBF0395643.1 hypothetical protein [Desulfobacterales bacterium]
MSEQSCEEKIQALVINEIQLILAEKRTSLAILRTGLGVFALPLSIFSFLLVTSKYYEIAKVIHFFIPILIINIFLVSLGGYLIIRAMIRIHHYDKLIKEHKSKYNLLSDIL